MCGIAGFIGGTWAGEAEASAALVAMGRSIAHRGPDHSAIWLDGQSGIGLAHNRLAIIDVSPAGNQPMHSHGGRYVIAFNGEIYNHQQLRAQLGSEGLRCEWKGHSDTETLLAAIEHWGLATALERSIGMFAFALWDRSDRTLILARDRLGEKPLYFGWGRGGGAPFLFGSELKALARHPLFDREIDRTALALYLRFNYIPAPFSIYRGISKLAPGSILILKQGERDPRIEQYWSAEGVAIEAASHRLQASPDECVDRLEQVLGAAVGRQMISDVPLGAFLSGGVDSSTIVALMQKQSAVPVRTFSIGFDEVSFDEAKYAKVVASHLGTDHTQLYVTPTEAMAVLPHLAEIYDEPFADSSQIPTFLVSALARKHVKVALSGDGGDELFGGYGRYGLTRALWQRLSAVPRPLRAIAAAGFGAIAPGASDRLSKLLSRFVPEVAGIEDLAAKVRQRSTMFLSRSVMELYGGMISQWRDPSAIVLGAGAVLPLAGQGSALSRLGPIEQMMALDTVSYLPDDILVKLDRASMAVSLETRVPLLDHQVVELAWQIPFEYKLRHGETKWILRQLLYRHVPRELIDRPKMGFGVPIGSWLRGPLREWAEGLLDEGRIRDEGFFEPEPIRAAWLSHLAGSSGGEHRLWTVLMFQSWLETHGSEPLETAGVPLDHVAPRVQTSRP